MDRKRKFRRGIYLLPTLFTVANLLCGFAAIVLVARDKYSTAAILIIVAGFLDGLDGRIARMTGTTSEFGVQFDTLADTVSFGVAPALLAQQWALAPLDRVGWLVSFVFVVCAAMRLARFNIRAPRDDKRFFAGLPSPAAAGSVAALAFAAPNPSPGWTTVFLAVVIATLALLMISRFRYRSFKEADLRGRRSYIWVLPLSVLLVAIAIQPRIWLVVASVVYVASAPLGYLVNAVRRLHSRTAPSHGDESEAANEPASR